MNKPKNHYLKLTEDFFKQDKVAILENGKHGFLFSNILLKLYLLSLKNNGDLLLSSEVKFNAELIAHLTGHKEAIVEQALVRFKELDLIKETENNNLSMTDFQLFHETSTAEAERKKAYRHKVKMGQFNEFVPEVSHQCLVHVTEQSPETSVDVLGTSVDVTETSPDIPKKSLENPITVPDMTQASPSDGSDLSLTGDKEMPTKGEDSPEDVNESSYVPFSVVPPKRKQKQGEVVPENLNNPSRKRLKPPKKNLPKVEEASDTQEPQKEQTKTANPSKKENDSPEPSTLPQE